MSDRNDNIVPPRWDGTNKNIQQIALTTSSQRVLIDPVLRNRCVRVKTSADIAFYLREDDSGTVDKTLATAAGPTSATLGYPMAAGTYEDFNFGGKDNYIVVQGGAVGILTLQGSGPPVTSRATP